MRQENIHLLLLRIYVTVRYIHIQYMLRLVKKNIEGFWFMSMMIYYYGYMCVCVNTFYNIGFEYLHYMCIRIRIQFECTTYPQNFQNEKLSLR